MSSSSEAHIGVDMTDRNYLHHGYIGLAILTLTPFVINYNQGVYQQGKLSEFDVFRKKRVFWQEIYGPTNWGGNVIKEVIDTFNIMFNIYIHRKIYK